METIIKSLQRERDRLSTQLEKLDTAIKALGGARGIVTVKRRKPKFTAAGLARIAAAQRARWAKIKRTAK